jgi:hypothetical protein
MEGTCPSPKKRCESTSTDSNSNVWLIERKTRNLNTRHFSKLAISESCPVSQHHMIKIYSIAESEKNIQFHQPSPSMMSSL